MPIFGASEEPKSEIPIARIEDMQKKGLTNNQIIQTLQRDGFTASQVFDALNQANMQPTQKMENPMNEMPPPPSFSPDPAPSDSLGDASLLGSSNEELIEAIIDEKWNELVKDITKVVQWKEQMTVKLGQFEQQMENLRNQFDKLHQAVIGKIGEYDKNILEVGAEVKAMEKVFSKVLPTFTENIAQLNQITEKMQGKE